MRKVVTPNRITALRVLIAVSAVALYAYAPKTHVLEIGALAIALTLVAVLLDGVDGFVARKFGLSTPLGAQIDILGDRILENLFFTAFAAGGLISLWVPVTFFVRGAAIDFLRGLAAARSGKSTGDSPQEHRRNWFLRARWSRAIVASRFSRAAYGAAKCICFCVLGVAWIAKHVQAAVPAELLQAIAMGSTVAVVITLAFCLLRAIPVVAEGWRDIVIDAQPTESTAAPQLSAISTLPNSRSRRNLDPAFTAVRSNIQTRPAL